MSADPVFRHMLDCRRPALPDAEAGEGACTRYKLVSTSLLYAESTSMQSFLLPGMQVCSMQVAPCFGERAGKLRERKGVQNFGGARG